MSKILALETSCEQASIALLVDGAVQHAALTGHANHSEHLLPSIRRLCAEAGVSLRALDAVAFGAGPGAFTGVRLACGVAQGIALGADLGVVPVGSLAALAMQAVAEGGEGPVCAITDARMGEVYAAAFKGTAAEVEELAPPCCVAPAELDFTARLQTQDWHWCGSALGVYGDVLEECVRAADLRCASWQPELVPHAQEVAWLAQARVAAGDLVAPEAAAPLYVRNKVALTTAERRARQMTV